MAVGRPAAVRTMFGRFKRHGTMRVAYLKSTPTPEIVSAPKGSIQQGMGFTDYKGPLSESDSTRVRMISGVVQIRRMDYIVSIFMQQERFMPTYSLLVNANFFKRPIGRMRMPVHGEEQPLGDPLTFLVRMDIKRSASYYLESMKPEDVFSMLAKQCKPFHDMLKRFNSRTVPA